MVIQRVAQAHATQASAEQAVPSVYNQVQARHATDAAPARRKVATNRSSEPMVSNVTHAGLDGLASAHGEIFAFHRIGLPATAVLSNGRPSLDTRCHGNASAHSICPSYSSVFAMSR